MFGPQGKLIDFSNTTKLLDMVHLFVRSSFCKRAWSRLTDIEIPGDLPRVEDDLLAVDSERTKMVFALLTNGGKTSYWVGFHQQVRPKC